MQDNYVSQIRLDEREQEAYIELFRLNTLAAGAAQIIYFTGQRNPDGSPIKFQGNDYIFLPVMTEGWGQNYDGTQDQPTVTISNVEKQIQTIVNSLGDLVGSTLERIVTFADCLDGAAKGGDNAEMWTDEVIILQKTGHTRQAITFKCGTMLDRMDFKLPRCQVIRQGDPRYGRQFPGVGLYKL